jgi:DNA repair photolyase
MNRIRDGYALVRNPVAKNVVHRVDLTQNNVDLLFLMTKDPRPMIPFLDELAERGISMGFQITITPYGRDVEPGVPYKADITEAFRTVSRAIGRERVVWRYDPIILGGKFDAKYHQREFDVLCKELAGYTERCIFSFVEFHEKLREFFENGTLRTAAYEEACGIGRVLSETAEGTGIELSLCCSEYDLMEYGIRPRGCIDREMMRSLGIPFEDMRVPLRRGCGCVKNIDIGEYDTCDHDCIYCYANRAGAARKRKTYDVCGEMLFDTLKESDTVTELSPRKNSKITDF